MEKKKLLLVAISVGVFLVLTVGAAILVFTPKNTNLPFETVTNNPNPETVAYVPPSPFQPAAVVSEQQSSSVDAVDLVRNPGGVPGLVTPESVISVTQPTTAAVPNTPPAGRAVNQSTPAVTTRPAQTTTPAQSSTGASQPASTSAKTTTPAQSSTSASQPASTPTQTTTPAQPSTSASQPASTSAKTTTTVQTIPAAATQPSLAAQAKLYDDYWVQTGAFSTIALAEGVKETLASKGITSIIENGNVNGRTLFRVRVGPYTSQNEANYWLALIQSMDGFEDSQVRQTQNQR